MSPKSSSFNERRDLVFAGHFGIAAAMKARAPEVPLWALIVGTQLYDVLFLPLSALSLESLEGEGYGGAFITAFYSHSLVSAIVIALLAALLAGIRWGTRTGVILGLVTFSHWLLDWIVHRQDLPVLPGNLGNLPLMGLGLWTIPAASLALEIAILATGIWLYFLVCLEENRPR
ncbi:permease [Paenibacillus planticolens]|uniref:permease n=1 Tax=Paenibacillus planticolens TaxID=2654976 RepID=UPI001FE8BAD3|nr:permease [Paenibacillus planticolens]